MFRSPLTLFKQSQKMCRIAHRRRRWAEYDYHLSKRLDGQIIHQKICIIHIYIVQCRNTSQYGHQGTTYFFSLMMWKKMVHIFEYHYISNP